MKKYRFILSAAAAAVLLCGCFGKSAEPAQEKTKENTETSAEPGSRMPEIQILDETPAPTEPETGAQENLAESAGAAAGEDAGQNAGQDIRETKAAGTTAAMETEAVKVYAVEAFEKTMYATATVNVRTSYTTKSKALASLAPGQKVRVTGRSANGWMRVIYEGQDAFVYQKYLSDSVPKPKQSAASPAQPGTNSLQPGNSEPATDVTTYPGNQTEDPPGPPGQIPLVEPAPTMTAPGQGSSAPQSGPGMGSPGGGSSWSETVVPGTGPGM